MSWVDITILSVYVTGFVCMWIAGALYWMHRYDDQYAEEFEWLAAGFWGVLGAFVWPLLVPFGAVGLAARYVVRRRRRRS